MKILAFSNEFPPYRGGISTYAVEMAVAAQALGAEITMVVPDYGKDLKESDKADYPFEVIRYAGGQHAAKDTFKKVALVGDILAGRKADLVHAMDWPFYIPVGIKARKKPRMLTLHGSEVFSMATPARRMVMALTGTLSGNVRIIGNSKFTEDLFRQHFPGIPSSKLGHELLGVGDSWLNYVSAPDARQRLALPPDKLIILTLARLTRRKGHLTVIEALRLLPPGLQAKLLYVIAGTGNEADYLTDLDAAMAGHPVEIRCLQGLGNDAVKDLCAASDMFCLPGATVSNNLVEGFGLVFLEAGAQGLAPIAGRIGGVAEVVNDGDSGLVVPTDDPVSLAAAIERLASDTDLRHRLGKGARRRAEELTWQRCAAATYGL